MKKLLKGVRTLAILCLQWGDTGKGKLVDFFARYWAHIVVRCTGGSNAGHTIEADGQKIVVHLVPSGIVYPKAINVIGSGVVLDPGMLCQELDALTEHGINYQGRLFIARNAKLVLPHHLVIDRLRDMAKSGRIDTTGRGIGPAYEDHYRRVGLIVGDLLNPEVFVAKLKRALEEVVLLLNSYDTGAIRAIMQHKDLAEGRYYSSEGFFNIDEIAKAYLAWGERLKPMIRDTDRWLRSQVGKKNILLEGAQGTLLSIDYGTYPFVTSSDSSLAGLAKGAGLLTKQVDLVLGIVKAPYMTRVGEGPFPPEMGGEQSNRWCGHEATNFARERGYATVEEMEVSEFSSIPWDDPDEFMFGILCRIVGKCWGATTHRPRRPGWLDLPLLRYAKQFNGPDVVLTKLDVMNQCQKIKICVAYRYDGPDHWFDGRSCLRTGDRIETAIPDAEILQHCTPIYEEFPGWLSSIGQAKSEADLPVNLMDIVRFIEKEAGVKARILSVGPDREQTVFRD